MLRHLFYLILDTVLPPRASEARVAALTQESLERLRGESGLPYHHEDVRALVWEVKYRKNSRALALAGEFLAEDLLALAAESLGKPLLVPVPMHKTRRRMRGYNQTELLCEAALSYLDEALEYAPHALTRIKNAAPQQTLARQKRLSNLTHSMQATNPASIRDRVCVVVDDVSTTGATLAEAKRALLAAGAHTVHTLALASS